MNEKKIIKRQLIDQMLYNLIAFTAIFTIFAIVIYNQVYTSVYSDVNNELLGYKDTYRVHLKAPNESSFSIQGQPVITDSILGNRMTEVNTFAINPRIIHILRDKEGKIINQGSIGRFYDEYLLNIKFDTSILGTVYNFKINNEYYYKGITYITYNLANEMQYVQLLINVDAEANIMSNLLKILTIGTITTVILSIVASYILSKRALEPVVESWEKQREFVQNASHELRTPLTIIQAKQEMLLKSPEDKIIDKSEEITLTLKEAKRLAKLTTDLNILARADSEEEEISKEKVNIDELLKEITKPYLEFANMQDKKIELKLEYQKEIYVNKEKIHQLMVILLDNAIRYTEKEDKIEIDTYLKDSKCVIEVKDTGIGISDEGLERIFDRFYREDKARTRESGGTGLGLSIAKWIAESHKGSIRALHNAPKGAIIVVRFPVA